MIDNYELNTLKMQDQIEELSWSLSHDWQNLEIHDVEEKIFHKLLEIGKNALSAFVENKGTGAA